MNEIGNDLSVPVTESKPRTGLVSAKQARHADVAARLASFGAAHLDAELTGFTLALWHRMAWWCRWDRPKRWAWCRAWKLNKCSHSSHNSHNSHNSRHTPSSGPRPGGASRSCWRIFCTADFPVCCLAGFPTRRPSAKLAPPGLTNNIGMHGRPGGAEKTVASRRQCAKMSS